MNKRVVLSHVPDPLSALLVRFRRRLGDCSAPGGTEELDRGRVDADPLLALG